jgi:hypothetical protein
MNYVRNIKKIFKLASPEEVRDGIIWYAEAQAAAKRLALTHGVPLRIVVGVIAALSPNNRWERNVWDADNLLGVYLGGGSPEEVKVSCYNAMKAKAWGLLDAMPSSDAEVMLILNGQKITSFFCNIMGHDTCTIDGHALNIARGERVGLTSAKTNVGKRLYADLQGAYDRAGKSVRVNGRPLKAFEMQAITWVVWRRIHSI